MQVIMKSSIFIIAEAGINYNGNINTAHKMVKVAASANADAIKFQSFIASEMASQQYAPDQYIFFKTHELTNSHHKELLLSCRDNGIEFMSTPFDFSTVDLLDSIGVNRFKIASCDLTNIPLIEYTARKHKPMYISTGMGTMNESIEAHKAAINAGAPEVVMMHCTTLYPAPYKDANLLAIMTMLQIFEGNVGFSDHTVGNYACYAAVALGARVIEKHFTLDKNMKGPDIKGSCNPESLSELVLGIRSIEESLGCGIKVASDSEVEIRKIVRRSIFALSNISSGEQITIEKLAYKRPGTGIPPSEVYKLIGFKAKIDISAGSMIKWDDVE